MERTATAFVRAEIVIPHTLYGGRPNLDQIVLEADSLAELDAKITSANNIAREFGRGAHINYGARYVINPETGRHEAVDAVSASARAAIVCVGRFIDSLTYGA